MKLGDRFTVNGKEYEVSVGGCMDCAFYDKKDECKVQAIDLVFFDCITAEHENLIAKEVQK